MALKHIVAEQYLPGSDHYRAYVGPAERYDLLGAGQFALLYLLGLRDYHKVLDFGCGSLRLGRLLIPFLQPDRYFGIEPNEWLVHEGFAHELGDTARLIKRPMFSNSNAFDCGVFSQEFDFIMAQSIVTHTGRGGTHKLLMSMADTIATTGLIVFNYVQAAADDGATDRCEWVYPGTVAYSPETMLSLVAAAGLECRLVPWPHPADVVQWVVAARSGTALPSVDELASLRVFPFALADER